MRIWLARRVDYAVIGPLFDKEWTVYLFSYGGLLLDLLIVPFLILRRTCPYVFVVAVSFHLMNAWLFKIGIFPWMAIVMTALFFAPDWPRRLAERWWPVSKSEQNKSGDGQIKSSGEAVLHLRQSATMALLGLYLSLQLLLPLRHHLYPGNVSWTEEGLYFAWHMKLRSKNARALFFVTDPESNKTWTVDPRDYLSRWQVRKMSTRPDMILQFSHHLAREKRKEGYEQVEVRAKVMASLNGRRRQLLVDPTVEFGFRIADAVANALDYAPNSALINTTPHDQSQECEFISPFILKSILQAK